MLRSVREDEIKVFIEEIKEPRVTLGQIVSLYPRVHKPKEHEMWYEVIVSVLYESQRSLHFKYTECSTSHVGKLTAIDLYHVLKDLFPGVHVEIIDKI